MTSLWFSIITVQFIRQFGPKTKLFTNIWYFSQHFLYSKTVFSPKLINCFIIKMRFWVILAIYWFIVWLIAMSCMLCKKVALNLRSTSRGMQWFGWKSTLERPQKARVWVQTSLNYRFGVICEGEANQSLLTTDSMHLSLILKDTTFYQISDDIWYNERFWLWLTFCWSPTLIRICGQSGQRCDHRWRRGSPISANGNWLMASLLIFD